MLNHLIQTIETLQERIKKHKDYLDYEKRTRVSLIDPMLRALGWDVDDPDQVKVEPLVGKSWADYALLNDDGVPIIFIEAKKLSENIGSHIQQTVGYAVTANMESPVKVPYCASTNGDDWRVYRIQGQDKVMDVSIAGNNSAETALEFLSLWRRSLSGGKFNNANEPLLGLGVSLTAAPVVTTAVATNAPAAPVATPPPTTGWTSLTGTFGTTKAPSPSAIRFPGGNEILLKAWRGVLIETALWLNRSSLLTKENCQIRLGSAPHLSSVSTRYLFSRDGLHADGGRFKSPVKLGDTGIIMEGNLSSKDIVRLAQKLLQQFNQDPSKVLLRLP